MGKLMRLYCKKLKSCLGAGFLLFLPLEATDRSPWPEEFLEFKWENDLLYQNYRQIRSHGHLENSDGDGIFYATSLRTSLFDFSTQIEGVYASTHEQNGRLDSIKASGKYTFKNDLKGDLFSLAAGATFTKAFSKSLKDISSFHHGLYELDVFVSIGKEASLFANWQDRWWIDLGIGTAEKGLPWTYFNGKWERRLTDKQAVSLFFKTLAGFGKKRLRKHDFKGYGLVAHRSCDIGIEYFYFTDVYGHLKLSYQFRPYANNFPDFAHLFVFSYTYPFGF